MYVKVELNFSPNQKEKIKQAFQNKTGFTLNFNSNQLSGPDFLDLTNTQIKKINSAKAKVLVLL